MSFFIQKVSSKAVWLSYYGLANCEVQVCVVDDYADIAQVFVTDLY